MVHFCVIKKHFISQVKKLCCTSFSFSWLSEELGDTNLTALIFFSKNSFDTLCVRCELFTGWSENYSVFVSESLLWHDGALVQLFNLYFTVSLYLLSSSQFWISFVHHFVLHLMHAAEHLLIRSFSLQLIYSYSRPLVRVAKKAKCFP